MWESSVTYRSDLSGILSAVGVCSDPKVSEATGVGRIAPQEDLLGACSVSLLFLLLVPGHRVSKKGHTCSLLSSASSQDLQLELLLDSIQCHALPV